ncbi:PREDICTED: tumor necrosis factor ligand superfamily member 15-like [Acanthisitta chloris]|uniref:Tumor necrosis factor ligand superfamily member 15 n=1 Tax=Acanthisitta chloris TaxID=57068 RepID=A0A091MNH4_9PASS|nr:PREDICTED: tumor necrosis factor ligand superfamily member 15-like [Acanthisitta chloris]KFP78346.1 Tumor necrosis factor ligand superfamily member 15 [Acanthisitta chloris]
MERVVEINPEAATPGISQIYGMHLREDLRRMRCTVLLCLLSVLLLMLPTAYLLVGNLRAPNSCASQVTEQMGSRFLKQRAVAAVTDTLSSEEKPRAHLTVKKQDLTETMGNHLPILQWEDKRGLAFTKNNLTYSSNALVIPVSGDYYVYAQVTFRGPIESYSKTNSVTEIITKVTDSYPEPTQLLTGTKTLSEKGNSWFQPIYLGAVVSLEVGDKLMVNVSDIKLVDYTKEHKTFFGAFLL